METTVGHSPGVESASMSTSFTLRKANLRLIMGAAHHDIIPRLLPLQVLVLQFQLGNVRLVMG